MKTLVSQALGPRSGHVTKGASPSHLLASGQEGSQASCLHVSPLWPLDAEHQQHRHVPTGHTAEG